MVDAEWACLKLNFALYLLTGAHCPVNYYQEIMTELPVKSARFIQGLSLRNRKDLSALRQYGFDGG